VVPKTPKLGTPAGRIHSTKKPSAMLQNASATRPKKSVLETRVNHATVARTKSRIESTVLSGVVNVTPLWIVILMLL
jgi:hypothetical protein